MLSYKRLPFSSCLLKERPFSFLTNEKSIQNVGVRSLAQENKPQSGVNKLRTHTKMLFNLVGFFNSFWLDVVKNEQGRVLII